LEEDTTNIQPSPQLPPQTSTEQPSPLHGLGWIFVGKNGIRAGWGIVTFALIFFAANLVISFLFLNFLRSINLKSALSPKAGLGIECLQISWVLIATAALALIERKSLFAYGYQGKARAVRFVSGLVWGFVAISAFVFVLWKFRLLAFDGRLLHGAPILKYAAAWGLVFLGTGIFEESTLRGYLQFTMTRGIGFWWGAVLLSFLFGFTHTINPGESPVGLFSAGAIGLVFCLSLWYTGSLWWAVGFHAAWDWGESYFYGTADSGLIARGHLFGEHPVGKLLWSGGLTGPEGSLLIVPLLVIIALGMWLWWGRRVQSPFAGSGWRPAWSRKRRAMETVSPNLGATSIEAS
jgi:uncharacterized protein